MAAVLRRNSRSPLAGRHIAALSTSTETPPATASKPRPAAAPSKPRPAAAPKPRPAAGSKPLSLLKSSIRSESDPDRIADLFQSSSHLRYFHSDRAVYKLTVQKLTRSRRPDLVHRVLGPQTLDPAAPKSEGFFIRIITLYSSAGLLDDAVQMFDRMAEIGCRRTEHSLCALLSAYLKNRQLDRVVEAFARVPAELGISPGIVAYNIVLKALCEKGDVLAARSLLDKIHDKESVKPDLVSYNILLNGYLGIADDTGFEEILKLISDKGLDATAVTYNCRISAFCRKKESFKAEELLDVMASKKVQPNRASFSVIISGFCKQGDVDSAMRVFKRMRAMKRSHSRNDFSPDSESYAMLTRGLIEKGEFVSALDVCRDSMTAKLVPQFELVKGLVEGLAKSSKVEEAKEIVEKMRKALKGDAILAWKKIEGTLALQP